MTARYKYCASHGIRKNAHVHRYLLPLPLTSTTVASPLPSPRCPSLRRLDGDAEGADKVYEGVEKPLTGRDVAEVCAFAVELPHHVDIDTLTLKPVAQAAPHKVIRTTS